MGVANTKSAIVTNADATSYGPSDASYSGGVARRHATNLEVAAADDDTSVYHFFRVKSNDRVDKLEFGNDAITGGTSFDMGLYDTAANGGAVVDADLFASAVDLSSAHGRTDYTYEATATNIDANDAMIWELLGLTADPNTEYDVCLTANTVGSGAGTIAGWIELV